ncbi:MAG: S4 domain-containing protein, partial [Planctomycetota bacterium]
MCSTSAEFEVDASGGVRLRCLVPPELAGKRLDAGLSKLLRNHTRWRVQRFVRAGRVVVNGSVAGPRHRLRPGDLLDVSVPEPPDGWYEPEQGPLTVLFEDEHLLAV